MPFRLGPDSPKFSYTDIPVSSPLYEYQPATGSSHGQDFEDIITSASHHPLSSDTLSVHCLNLPSEQPVFVLPCSKDDHASF
jgi:hypothetical protein